MSEKKIFIYCNVLPENHVSPLYYMCDFDVQPGDIVVIPLRSENMEKVGLVLDKNEYTEKDAPYPPEYTKYILRKFGDNEPDKLIKEKANLEIEKAIRFRSEEQLRKIAIKESLIKHGVGKEKINASKVGLKKIVESTSKKKEFVTDMIANIYDGVILSDDGKTVTGFKASTKSKVSVCIPSGVEKIEDDVFLKVNIDSLFLPKELKYLGKFTICDNFGLKPISSIEVEDGNKNFAIDNTGFYNIENSRKTLLCLIDRKIVTYKVPNDVNAFEDNAFENCPMLEHIILSDGVDEFNEYALPNDTKVKEIFLPKSVKHLYPKELCGSYSEWNTVSYRIDEDNDHIFRDEDSIYEVLDDGTYKLITCTYNGKGKTLILNGTSIIGARAFKDHTNVTDIEFPESLKIIEEEAFSNTGLKSLIIPDNVKHIECMAFSDCNNLKSVQLYSGIEYIEEDAFESCWELKRIKSEGGKKAFSYNDGLIKRLNASNQNRPINSNNTKYKTAGDVKLYSAYEGSAVSEKDRATRSQFSYSIDDEEAHIINWIGDESVKTAVIPATIDGKPVISLNSDVFESYTDGNLKEIIISEGVKRLEAAALFDVENLKKIVFPTSLEYISPNVFSDKNGDYKDLYLNSETIYVAPAGSYAEKFLKEYKPENDEVNVLIVVNEDSDEAENIAKILTLLEIKPYNNGFSAKFKDYISDELKSPDVKIPAAINGKPLEEFDLEEIPNHVKKLTIPASVRSLLNIDSDISGQNMEQIDVDPENEVYSSDGKAVFSKDKKILLRFMAYNIKEYTIPEGTEIIGKSAFGGSELLEKLILPKTIKKINSHAFGGCKKLENIQGLEYVSEADEDIFTDNSASYINIPPILIIGSVLFKYNDLTQKVIKIPDGVKKICNGTFDYCKKLESLYIPASVEKIDRGAFPYKSESVFKSIDVDPGNNNYCSVNGMLLSKDKTELLFVPDKVQCDKLVIPDGVKIIADNSFAGNKTLTELVLPDTVIKIGESAFSSCCNLKKTVFPKSLECIGEFAFFKCSDLEEIIFPEGLKSIEKGAFSQCTKLGTVLFPESLEYIGDWAFEETCLENVTLPDNLIHIGSEAFAKTDIKNVILPKSVKTLGWGAFSCVPEIEVYDSIDPNAKDADAAIDTCNGEPNSMVGYIGIGPAWAMWECAANHRWVDHTITVRSAETGEIKYKVWMGADSSQRSYYCFLSSAWGHNATFAFDWLDKFFPKIRGQYNKLKVAKYRLEYPYKLSDEAKAKYEAYIEKFLMEG